MKARNCSGRACFAMLALCAGGSVQAGGLLSAQAINKIAFNTGGLFLYAGGWSNPNGCTNADAIVLLDTDINYEKAYAMLLAAYLSGKSISGYSDGCVTFDGRTYNTIRGFKYLTIM